AAKMTRVVQPRSCEPACRLADNRPVVTASRPWLRRTIAVLLSILALWLGGIAQAGAHASLIASQPPDGAMIAQPPANLVLSFNEPVLPLVLRLVNPGGETVSLPVGGVAGATLVVDLPPLGDGAHLISWRVMSAD